jgi:hypothetical protein
LSKLIGQFKHSPDACQELVKLTGKMLLSPSTTRWGYWIPVLKRYLSIEEGVKKVARRKKWILPDQIQTEFLRELVPVLEPFMDILISIQASKTVSISHAYTNLKILKTLLSIFIYH